MLKQCCIAFFMILVVSAAKAQTNPSDTAMKNDMTKIKQEERIMEL